MRVNTEIDTQRQMQLIRRSCFKSTTHLHSH